MATSEHQTPVNHIVVEATQPYERVIQAFEAQIGREKAELVLAPLVVRASGRSP